MSDSTRTTFGDRLRQWRTDANPPANLQELADLIGKSQTYMLKMERGDLRPPDREACAKIAARLGRHPEEVWHHAADELLHRPPYNELLPYVQHLQALAGDASVDVHALNLFRLLRDYRKEFEGSYNPARSRLVLDPLTRILREILEDDRHREAAQDFFDIFRLLEHASPSERRRRIRDFLGLAAAPIMIRGLRDRGADVPQEAFLAQIDPAERAAFMADLRGEGEDDP